MVFRLIVLHRLKLTHNLCIHIRRGDYVGHAMEHSRKEFVQPAGEYVIKYLKESILYSFIIKNFCVCFEVNKKQ
ncbi:hypothetical protein L596_013071 [Steinernema carpocapsae]|uniref:Uncharacterized protein n=1 Tax=Steinernema carpocapsae TaxID=34508 RepID=A0A4U5NZ15_STECR|nr:hypothetical protein L596_013071 [Steinernema carpocapsae]